MTNINRKRSLILSLSAVFLLWGGVGQAQETDATPSPKNIPTPMTGSEPSPSPSVSAPAESPEPSPSPSEPAPEGSPEPSPSPSEPAPEETKEPEADIPNANSMKIMEIEIVGTEHKDAVLLSMFTKPGDQVTPNQVRDDLRRIYGLGYFLDVSATRKPVEGGYNLVIYAQENPVLKSVQIVNDLRVFTKDELLAIFEGQVGKTGNLNDLRDSKDKIEELYRNKGYSLANVVILQERLVENGPMNAEGILELQINEGIIEDLRVDGNTETKPHIILREMTLKPGDLFNSQTMQTDLARVFNTNFFEAVNLTPKPGEKDPNHIILIVDVKEKPTGSVNLGAGYNTRDGVIGTFSIMKDNLMGEGRRISVDAQFGIDLFGALFRQDTSFSNAQRTLLGRVDFYDPWMFPGRTSFGAGIYSERVPLFFGSGAQDALNLGNGIIQTRTGISLTTGRPLFGDHVTSPWRGLLSFRAEQVGVTDLNRVSRPDLSVSKRPDATDHIFSIGGSVSYDTRDVIIDPKKGWYGLLSAEPVWGDAQYLKLSGNLSTYIGITDWLTLALGTRTGTYLGKNPPYEQFYSNGFNVIRGWPENGFLHGNSFVIGSAEARFPIFNPISGVVFMDVGEFFPLTTETAILNQGLPFKYGVGLGIRLNTPMGPLRLDYGVRDFSKLNFNTLLEAGQIHFSIGQKF